MRSEEKTAEMIGNYKDHRQDIEQGKKPNQQFKLAEAKQKMAAQQGVLASDNGEVMLRRRFLVWSTDRQTEF